MPIVTLRVSPREESQIEKAAQKSGIAKSEYIRRTLFDGSSVSRIDFFKNVNTQIDQIVRQSIFTTQLICQILVNQTDSETVQKLLEEITNRIEMENNADE